MTQRLLPILGFAALVGAACTATGDAGPAPYRPPGISTEVSSADAGQVLYDRDCGWCHGANGEGTFYGPNLDGELDGGAYTHFMLVTGRMPIDAPGTESRSGPSRYDEAQIDAIVEHVKTFGGTGPDVPSPDPEAGDITQGAELYLDLCAACHSSAGAGGALTSGEVVPDLQHVSPVVVAEAILVGPGCRNDSPTCGVGEGAMPRFELTDEELDSIVRYVQYLGDPVDEGGAPIGRVGPVAEGAIAIVLGLGLLVLAIRWIGTRTGEDE